MPRRASTRRFRARARGEWPEGVHWSPGEERDVPADWPGADGTPPAWLEEVPSRRRRRREVKNGAAHGG